MPHCLPRCARWLAVAGLACLAPAPAAGAVALDAATSGYYDADGNGCAISCSEPYEAGFEPGALERRGYVVFDVSGVVGTVTAARLRLECPAPEGVHGGGFESVDASETVGIFDFTGNYWHLITEAPDRIDEYVDLGTGALFGSSALGAADEGRIVEIALDARAVSAVQHHLDVQVPIAFGIAVTTLDHAGGAVERVFANTGRDHVRQLVLDVVPEPAGGLATAAALTALAALGRRARLRRSG